MGVSEVPGVERWSYEAFHQDEETGTLRVPLVRDDGTSTAFTVPSFVEDPDDLRSIARLVIDALERWEAVKGLGA
jgi:hypothetical protein